MFLLLSCLHPAPPPSPLLVSTDPTVQSLIMAARTDALLMQRLTELCDLYPARLAGSMALEGSLKWAEKQLLQDKQENVRLEPVLVPVWVRGEESLELLAPLQRSITMLGLGGSVGGIIEGELIAIHNFEELGPQVTGKIVLFNVPMKIESPAVSGYGEAVDYRVRGASEAAKYGAAGMLLRSVTTHSLDTAHTGMMKYQEDVPKIPAAAIPPAEADILERLSLKGPVQVRLSMGASTLPDAPSANVVGELLGREKPEEIIVVGGHIDSWDVGQGAQDDGAGVVQAIEALRLIREAGLKPRRTIRVVLYTNEENGLRGGKAYAEAHKGELHVAALESDLGAGAPLGWVSNGTPEQQRWFLNVAAMTGLPWLREGGGADISTLTGTLQIGLQPDDSHYFDYHHTKADTIETVNEADYRESLGAVTALTWLLAETP
jgi:hypothetical protein